MEGRPGKHDKEIEELEAELRVPTLRERLQGRRAVGSSRGATPATMEEDASTVDTEASTGEER